MHAMGNVIDMRRFGGLRRIMPVTYATFLVGCLALAGVPPLSGFWSKDAILGAVHDKVHELSAEEHGHASAGEGAGSPSDVSHAPNGDLDATRRATFARVYQLLYYGGLGVALLTAFYTFRAFFLTFFGDEPVPREAGHHAHESPASMFWPLIALAVFAAIVGLHCEVTHSFVHHLGQTPSLAGGAVAMTTAPGQFHLSVFQYGFGENRSDRTGL